jgi:O-antigen ligase
MGVIMLLIGPFFYYTLLGRTKTKSQQHFQCFFISFRNIMIFFIACLLVFVSSFIFNNNSRLVERIKETPSFISSVIWANNEIKPGDPDYKRQELADATKKIIQKHWLLGTGVGLENYRIAFREISDYQKESRAHNFFLSYLAEFGVIGFSLMLYILFLLFIAFENKRKRISDFYSDDKHKILLISFESGFLVVLVSLTMNEYISFPLIWFFWGIGLGIPEKHMNVQNVGSRYFLH